MGMEAVQILIDCEEAFGIEIPDQAIELPTIGEFSNYISHRVANLGPDVVWETVRRIASETLLTPIDEIHPESHWVDLD